MRGLCAAVALLLLACSVRGQDAAAASAPRPPPPKAAKPPVGGPTKRLPASARPSFRPTVRPSSAGTKKAKKVDQKGGASSAEADGGPSNVVASKRADAAEPEAKSSSTRAASSSGHDREHSAIAQGRTTAQDRAATEATSRRGGGNTTARSSSSLRIAFCLTGQLARLELVSKIQNIFVANAKAGHQPHVFVWLDRDVGVVKQTYWNYNYNNSVFGGYDRRDVKAFIDYATTKAGVIKTVRTRVKLELPSRYTFAPVRGVIPVKDKTYSGHDGPRDNFESAATRFQNNMRWMAGLRDCVKWVMETEQLQGWHYDLVVRLRDDTYALGPWVLDTTYLGAMTSSLSGNFRGINDHNFVIARKWADTLFRGFTEDYYFNSTLERVVWGNPENRIRTLAEAYGIPVRGKNICQQPLIPLRGLVNDTFWHLHPLFIRHFFHDCIRLDAKGVPRPGSDKVDYEDIYEENPLPTCCRHEWMLRVHDRAVPALPPPNQRIYGNNPPVSHDDLYEPPLYRRP